MTTTPALFPTHTAELPLQPEAQHTSHAHTDYFREHPCAVYWGYMGVTALLVAVLDALAYACWTLIR